MGQLRSPINCGSIECSLFMEGIIAQVRLVGGLFVLVTFGNRQDVEVYLDRCMDLFEPWFVSLTPYCVVQDERSCKVWVKLEEIPLHMWHEDCFKAIRDTWGSFIKVDKDIKEKWRLDQALICGEVKSLRNITTYTHLMVNGRDYFVRSSIMEVEKTEPRVRPSSFYEAMTESVSKSHWSKEDQNREWEEAGEGDVIEDNFRKSTSWRGESGMLQSPIPRFDNYGYIGERWSDNEGSEVEKMSIFERD